jgi:hypothetical protein
MPRVLVEGGVEAGMSRRGDSAPGYQSPVTQKLEVLAAL